MLVGEQSPAPRVVAGVRKLRPELTPIPAPAPADPNLRISGVLRQYYSDGIDVGQYTWVHAAVRGGCLLAWRDGTLPLSRRPGARLPLRHLHLRAAPTLLNAFQLSRLRDDASVATFQACNATDYARWVRALCIEILGQTPLPQVRFLDVLSATDSACKIPKNNVVVHHTPCPPVPPPRARRRLLTSSSETQVPRRDHSPAATDEGIVVEDDDYDSSSDRSLDLSLSLDALKTTDVVDAPVRRAEVVKCDNCSKLNAAQQHHTLPRAARAGEVEQGRHRYLKRWETAGEPGRARYASEASRRKAASLETRARSCSPNAHDAAAKYIPVRERKALFESLSQSGGAGGLARSSEQLARPAADDTPRRTASLHDLQAPPSRSVSDLRQFFESVARGAGGGGGGGFRAPPGLQRHSAPPYPAPRAFVSLTCA